MAITRLTAAASVTLRRRAKDGGTCSLSLPSAAILADSSGHAFATQYIIGIIGYKNRVQQACTIGTINVPYNGITASILNNGTTSASVVLTITTSLTTPNGTIDIPVTMDGEQFVKTFSFALTAQGKDAIYTDLDNEFDSMLYTGAGDQITQTVQSQATLYDGGKPQRDVTWQLSTASGCSAKVSASGLIIVDGMTATDGYVIAYTSYKGQNYTAKFTLKKLVGVDKYEISPSQASVVYNATSKLFDNGSTSLNLEVKVYVTKQNNTRQPVNTLPSGYTLTCNGNSVSYGNGKGTYAVSSEISSYQWELKNGSTMLDTETVILATVSDGPATDVYTIVFEKSQLTEGENGTAIYVTKTTAKETPQCLSLTQMDAEKIGLIGTGVERTGSGYRLYVAKGVVYGVNYTVIATKDGKEIARGTIGVNGKGEPGKNSYLAQVVPSSLEISTNADFLPNVATTPSISVSLGSSTSGFVESDKVVSADDYPKYDTYMSANKGIQSSASKMSVTFSGVEEIILLYGSSAESNYDYIMLSKLNTPLPSGCVYDNEAVAFHTRGAQSLEINKVARYTNLDPTKQYKVEAMFIKDGSQDVQPDRGYLAVPQVKALVAAQKYTIYPSMQNAKGRVAFDFYHGSLSLPSGCGFRYEPDYPDIDPSKPESEQHLGGEFINLYVTAQRKISQCELLLPVANPGGEATTQVVRFPITPIANGATTAHYALDIPSVVPVGIEDFALVVVRTSGTHTKRLTYAEAIEDGIHITGTYVEILPNGSSATRNCVDWTEQDQQFYLEGGTKKDVSYRITLYRNDVKLQEYIVRCVGSGEQGMRGNSLSWHNWSEVRKQDMYFFSSRTVGDTCIADIVVDDITVENGIKKYRKYLCISTFEHKASLSDLPQDYADPTKPNQRFEYVAHQDNIATDLLISDAVSTKVLEAVNANIEKLDAEKITVRNVEAQSSDKKTTVKIDGKEGKLTAKNADISGKITATEGEFNGTVKAKLMYAPTKMLDGDTQSYTFDPVNDPCNTIYLGDRSTGTSMLTTTTLNLPSAETYDGLVLSVMFRYAKKYYSNFHPVHVKSQRPDSIYVGWGVAAVQDVNSSFQHVCIVEDMYDNPRAVLVSVRPNHLVQFKAIAGNWYIISGCVQIISREF